MDANIFISPTAGAIIGTFTNYIAIKMLFKPYTAKYAFGIKLPLTPGLIPKEKPEIAKSIGATIGTHLLSEDVVTAALTKDDVLKSIEKVIDESIISLKNNNSTVKEFILSFSQKEAITDEKIAEIISSKICSIISEEKFKNKFSKLVYNKLLDYANKNIEDLPYEKISVYLKDIFISAAERLCGNVKIKDMAVDRLWQILCKETDNEKQLKNIISVSTSNEIKDYVSLKIPAIANAILNAAEDEEIEKMLKIRLSSIISSVTGSFVGMFIKTDDVYVKIIEKLTIYFNNPENIPQFEKTADILCDKFFEMTIGEICTSLTGQMRENTLNKALYFIFEKFFSDENIYAASEYIPDFFEKNKNKSAAYFIEKYDENIMVKLKELVYSFSDSFLTNSAPILIENTVMSFVKNISQKNVSFVINKFNIEIIENIKAFILFMYKKTVAKAAPTLLGAFDISMVVEEQINLFSMADTEKIVMSIADKELKAITAFGGILGFIIGFIPVIINML